jgi:protocatechuate 3,4-dioxygenase beta subunit
LPPPPKIAGTVRDPSGAPVPNFTLRVFPASSSFYARSEAKTDSNGRYEIGWNPALHRSSISKPSLLGRDLERNLAVAEEIEDGASTHDIRLEPGLSVSGRVQDAKGVPLSNAVVTVYLWSGRFGSEFEDKPIRSDSQGRFQLSALPPGRHYGIEVSLHGYGRGNHDIQPNVETNHIELEPFVLKVVDQKIAGRVVDADDKPVARAYVNLQGQDQPYASLSTDAQGRFSFDACEGQARLYARHPLSESSGNVNAEGGDTNVCIRLGANQRPSPRPVAARSSLKGRPLPALAAVNLAGEAVPTNKPVLLCLFDSQQRPSRRFVRQLAEQHDALHEKGLTILGLQATVIGPEAFKEWKDANPLPFPVGCVTEKSEKTKWASEFQSLPWLILSDAQGRVIDEGFPFEELQSKLKSAGK